MTAAPTTAWLVAALAGHDHVHVLGQGWDEVVGALTHQGVEVTTDGADAGTATAVAVDLGAAGALDDAVALEPEVVVTHLDLGSVTDAGALAGTWPLALRGETSIDSTWVAAWTRTDAATHEVTRRLLTALHTTALGLRVLADAAVEDRESAARSAAVASRRQGAAEARARATSTLADRWAASQDVLVDSLVRRLDQPPATTPTAGPAASGLRALFGRGSAGGRDRAGTAAATPVPGPPAAGGSPPWPDRPRSGSRAGCRPPRSPRTRRRAADLVDDVGGHLDVLVVGRVATDDRAGVVALVDRAREADAFVVGVANGGMPWAGFEDLCDVVLTDHPGRSAARTVAAPQPVDPTVVNPTLGFRWSGTGLLTVCTGEGIDPTAVTTALAAAGVDSELVGAGTDQPLPHALDERARRLARCLGVVDVPAAHATVAEHARTLVGLAAAGIAVVALDLPEEVRTLLGPVLATALTDTCPTDLDDPTTRERTSVRQRRAALWTHTTEARWRRLGRALDLAVPTRPTVSAVVVTNRPTHLAHCAEQLAAQTYRPLEVVLGLHGTAFTPAQVDAFAERVQAPVTGVAIEGHRTLGEGLNVACRAAGGDILTKWDDDDHYGPDHVIDLVQALEYSGATIVGKGAEFVHLGQLDLTIRRFVGRAESGSRSLAGGTLALRREDLAAAGGWRRIPRSVDQRLLDDVERAGGRIHRTHGFGFVLERRADGHTWSVDVDYFLRQSEAQWRGLPRHVAGLDDSVLAPARRDAGPA